MGTSLSPSYEFQCDQMQEEKKIAQLVFLKQNKFLFFCLGKKNLIIKKNQLNSSHTENHTRLTNLSA
jgi:hypothetical protein